MTRFSVLAALWALALALLLEPALTTLCGDADVALSVAAALTSAALATLAKERKAYVVPLLTLGLAAVVVLVFAKPLRLSACDGSACIAEDARALTPWLWAVLPASAVLGVALSFGGLALRRRVFGG